MMSFSLFVVDDEDIARQGIALALQKHYQVSSFSTAEDALEAMTSQPPDLILLDIGLPGISGIEALERIKARQPDILVIMITAYEDVQTVVSAMKLGAYDYIVKPLDMNGLIITVRNALETIALKKEIRLLQQKYIEKNLPRFVGESKTIKDIMAVVNTVARSVETPVLILGETGTGKELIAQTIHYLSPNFKGPLVPVNCAAIPKELIESELFGYEKGAFSGADSGGKAGLVEEADNGTLFLDEVADLSLEAQAKLLRFLESGEYFRVGGTRKHQVRTRLISATNKDLFGMSQQGGFRADLYYRLAVVKIEVPSLNQRSEDVLLIAKFFLDKFSKKFGKTFTGLSTEAGQALQRFHWTGNIRELRNMIERAVLLGIGPQLTVEHLGLEAASLQSAAPCGGAYAALPQLSLEGIDLLAVLNDIERDYFEQALKLVGGNESKAAKLLNLSRDKFRYRHQKH